jgi:hypothetical protein
MAVRFPIVAYTYDELNRDARPGSAQYPESIPYTFYDQQDLASAWANATFFATVRTDPTLGNIQQANTLSAEQYFRLHAVTADFIVTASTTSSSLVNPLLDDIVSIFNTSRALVNMSIAMKTYIQTPLNCFHASGGINAQFQLGAPQGSAIMAYIQNWYPDGGYNIGGAIVLPPKQTFSFSMQAATGATLTATRAIRFTLWGVLSRPVR